MHEDNPCVVHVRLERRTTHQSDGMLNAILRPCDKLKHRNSLLCHPTLYPTIRLFRNRKTAKKYPLLFVDLVCKRRPVCGLIRLGRHGIALLMLLLLSGAGPATKPIADPYAEIVRLKMQIALLEKQVQQKDAELIVLRSTLFPSTRPVERGEVRKGMTIAQVNTSLAAKGEIVAEDDDGTHYEWKCVQLGKTLTGIVEDDRLSAWAWEQGEPIAVKHTREPRKTQPAREYRFPEGR